MGRTTSNRCTQSHRVCRFIVKLCQLVEKMSVQHMIDTSWDKLLERLPIMLHGFPDNPSFKLFCFTSPQHSRTKALPLQPSYLFKTPFFINCRVHNAAPINKKPYLIRRINRERYN